jgi:hypothetical protein
MPKLSVTPDIIDAAIQGFEYQKEQIDRRIAELRALRSGESVSTVDAPAAPTSGRRTLSTEARQRIAAAQRKRWAATRKGTAAVKAAPKTRRLSPAGRRAIIAATKRRWAALRAAQAAATA